jgi:DNA-binding NarL/FixJ family response regulator
MNRVRVVLVEDQELIRDGVARLLADIPGVVLVGTAGSLAEALSLFAEKSPDVALVDVGLPDGSGISLVQQALKRWPEARMIMLSSREDAEAVGAAFSAGALSCVFKSASREDLKVAIAAASEGRRYVSPALAEKLAEWASPDPALSAFKSLTPRQLEVLRRVALGQSTKVIADELAISVTTVNTHRVEIMKRLGIRDVASLTRFAIHRGLIEIS